LEWFYGYDTRITTIKAKRNKCDYIKMKSSCIAKETISKMKTQPTEREKILANYISDKALISKIYKGLLQLKSEQNNVT